MRIFLLILAFFICSTTFAAEHISNLVNPVSYFVNHINPLNDLKSKLFKYKRAGLVGMSGIGKTQIARTFAYNNKDEYDLIWFIDCNLDINTQFAKLAKQINKIRKTKLSDNRAFAADDVMDYLTLRTNWLLVLDNLKIGENDKVKHLLEWESNGYTIFVSQDRQNLPNIIEVTKFGKKAAISLASGILKERGYGDAALLAEGFNGYPVLIVQGSKLLNQIQGLDEGIYMKKVLQSEDKIKSNILLALRELKPTASDLLYRIALINNQSFSKSVLQSITASPATLDEDIFQLSNFSLISNTNSSNKDSLFEMHDVTAQKLLEINERNNKKYIEDLMNQLLQSIPNSVVKAHLFRETKSMYDNIIVILRNAEMYKGNLYHIMALKLQLLTKYVNSLDVYHSKQLIDWFNVNNKNRKFVLQEMNNLQKAVYCQYLAIIGGYYRRIADYKSAIIHYVKAKELFNNVKGYDSFKRNVLLCLGKSHLALGETIKAENIINGSDIYLDEELVDDKDKTLLYFAKARLFFMQGRYKESLESTNRVISRFIEGGIGAEDLYLTGPYMLKIELLNILEKYDDSYVLAKKLYDMQKAAGKKETHEIFSRIFTQMARTKLHLGEIEKANGYIRNSIKNSLADKSRNPGEKESSKDPDLANSYTVQGDILLAQESLDKAIDSYRAAQKIYFYLYRDNSKNIAQVSYLNLQGAKASCKAKDLYHYKCFGDPQIKDFGRYHPNTIGMLNYCNKHNMNLWRKDD